MSKRLKVILAGLTLGLIGALAYSVIVRGQEAKELPKTVGLTEVQRLKDENYQLKVNSLQQQINLLQAERSEMLKGALKVAGVDGPDIERYQYDQQKFVFTLQEKAAVKAPSPTPANGAKGN